MEEREAIAKLKETTDYRYSHYAYVNDTGKAFDMAIKALEKQGLEKRKSEKSMRIETEKFIEEQPTVQSMMWTRLLQSYRTSHLKGTAILVWAESWWLILMMLWRWRS